MADRGHRSGGEGGAAERALQADLLGLAERGETALLFSADGSVLWTTPAGAALLGKGAPLGRDGLRAPLWTAERHAELLAAIAPGGTRLERVRVVVGRRSDVLTLACRKVILSGGEPLLLAVAMGGRPSLVGPAVRPAADLPSFLTPPPSADDPAAPGDLAGAEPVTIDTLRAKAGRPAVRVLWSTDAEGRFLKVTSELDDLLGPGAAPAVGERLEDALARGLRDEEAGFALALARQETFTNVVVMCPVRGTGAYLPVVMSGVPGFDPSRRFEGFRGFGLCRLERLVELAPLLDAAAPPAPGAADAAESAAASAPAHAVPHATTPAPSREPAGEVIPFAPVQGSAQAQLVPTNVVPLKASTRPIPTKPPGTSLSRSERHAFREIARALGARVEGDEEADPPSAPDEPATATPVDAAQVGPAQRGPEPGTVEEAGPASAEEHDLPDTTPLSAVDVLAGEAEGASGLAAEADSDRSAPVREDEPLLQGDAAPAADPARADETQEETQDRTKDRPVTTDEAGVEPLPVAPSAEPLAGSDEAAAPRPAASLHADLADNAEAIFDRLPVGILVSRGDVPIVVNRTLLELTGYEDIDAFHAEGGLPHLFRHAAHGPDSEGGTLTITTREGEMLPVDVRLQSVRWSGLPATLVSFRRALDPEGEKRIKGLEAALGRRERETRELRAIMDTATDGVIVLDGEGRILSVNRSCEALFGYDQPDIEGEPFITLFAPDSHATALDYLDGLRANGVASVLNDGREVVGRVRQGGRIPLFMTLGAIGEAPDRKFCAVLRDITSWKKAEIDLTEAKRAAEEASAQKSDFLAKISHEIRTPLSAIIGFAEVMIEERFGPIGNERYLEYLRDIHASGGHVISLVNDLLDLSKIEAGRFDLTFTSVNVNEIVTRAVALMQPQAGTGRVVVRTALASQLPKVVADERSLRQIVLNLLSNGIKFTDPGGQVIVSTALTDAGEVAVRIRDTGIGMTEKEIETALEPFRQVATTRRAGGTGLGLPLTKALVEANRASLAIRSARDAGTLVEITFPTTRVLAE
ncbi:MAG: PAS domain S-box protein [Alsobacter sp.]